MHILVLLFLSNLFSSDMIIIVFVALLLFGGEKLPEIARGLGRGIRDFKDASEGIKREINEHINSLEEKKAETSLNNQAAAVQNQISENTGQLNESQPYIENTMPVNENYFTGNENNTMPEGHPVAHNGPVTGEHAVGQHNDDGTTDNGSIKNS